MTTTPASTAAPVPLAPGRASPDVPTAGWLCPIEKHPFLHAFVQTIPGKLILLLLFAGLMKVMVNQWGATAVMLLLLSLLPRFRKQLLIVGAVTWIFLAPPLSYDHDFPTAMQAVYARHGASQYVKPWFVAAAVAIVWMFAFGYIGLVRRYPKSPIGRRPMTGLFAVLVALLLLASSPLMNGLAWFSVAALAMVMGQYIWYFGYTLTDSKNRDGTYPPIQVGYWRYFWATNRCPIGKGASYLDRVEAKDANELATVQLKGLKLLIWAAALSVVKVLATNILYGPYSESHTKIPFIGPLPGLIPTYQMAIDAQVSGEPVSFGMRWAALAAKFMLQILDLSIWGHKLIAVARMAGFNAFRMTYKPLYATSIAEFFNRIHWYLKEMLATFFFYPTYLRYFKKHPRLRVFAATMAAACFGNFLYHFLAYDRYILDFGFWEALKTYQHYAVYCVILGVAIGISQIRILNKKKAAPAGFRKVLAIAGVMLFFCLLNNFDNETRRDRSVGVYFSYFLNLFRPW